jgi:hypothetical protein
MDHCDSLLQRLSQYLDGLLPDSELPILRQEAATQPGCLAMLDAMLWVHQSLETAPMAEAARDFSISVTKELAWRQRRDKILLGGILTLAALVAVAPLLLLVWAGLAAALEPGLMQNAIGWLVGQISDIAAYGVAILTLIRHLPQWAIVSISTFISLSFLLLALALVMQKAPEQLFAPSEMNRQRAV